MSERSRRRLVGDGGPPSAGYAPCATSKTHEEVDIRLASISDNLVR